MNNSFKEECLSDQQMRLFNVASKIASRYFPEAECYAIRDLFADQLDQEEYPPTTVAGYVALLCHICAKQDAEAHLCLSYIQSNRRNGTNSDE